MLESLIDRWAWHRALKLVKKRAPRTWVADPSQRRVLLVLPDAEESARYAWRFIAKLSLDPERTLPVIPIGKVTFAPVEYLGRVRTLQPSDVGRLGLPKKSLLREVWEFEPDIGICLSSPFALAPAVIVGASPAAFRAGFFAEGAEPFFDLLAGGADVEARLNALGQALSQIEPPILAASAPPAGRGTPAW
jgi:hypothetical protein